MPLITALGRGGGESEFEDYPRLHGKFKVTPERYMRPCLKKKERKKKESVILNRLNLPNGFSFVKLLKLDFI